MQRIINQAYLACREILVANKDKIEALAEKLLEQETLSLPDIVEIMGERPFPMKESVVEYLAELKARQEVDEQLDADERELQAKLDEKKKQEQENMKFDANAEDKEKDAEGKDGESDEKKKE